MGKLRRLFDTLFNNFRRTKMRFVVVGLDNSGKTTLLNQLRPSHASLETVPTVGFSIEEFTNHGIKFCAFDMSGQGKYRSLWENYYPDCEGIIFVVDSTDLLRLAVVQNELYTMLRSRGLGEKPYVPIVFFANKMDLPDAASLEEISAGIGLPSLASSRRPTNIVRCSATTGEGVEEGIMWLIDMIKQNRNAAASTQ